MAIENFEDIKQELRCCVVRKSWQTAHNNLFGIEDADCEQKALLINAKFQIVDRYVEVGTVRILSVDASADIDLTGIVLGDGMSGTIYVDIAGNVTFIASFSGDFAGLTLSDFIDALIAAILAGGSGFTATNNDPILTITAPLNLGANPVGSTIFITLAPVYTLRYERQNIDETGFILSIRNPAYVNDPASAAYGYLYVTSGSLLVQTDTRDYTGVVVTDPIQFQCVPGISPIVMAIGNIVKIQDPVTTFVIRASITNYNVGTGLLDADVVFVAGAVGNATWTLTSWSPVFSTINVYEFDLTINPPVGALNFLQTMYVQIGGTGSCFYDPVYDAVFLLGASLANDGLGSALARIDCSSPFVLADVVPLFPYFGLALLMDNPVTNNLYFTIGFAAIGKANKSPLAYNAASEIGTFDTDPSFTPPLIFGQNYAKTVNPTNGEIYYSQHYGDLYRDYVLKLTVNPSLAVKDIPSVFFQLVSTANVPLGVGVWDMFYYAPSQLLFVARYLGTKYVLQTYNLTSGVAATIRASVQEYLTPVVTGSTDGFFDSVINYQPGHNKILLTNVAIVFVFDPDTLTFDSSFVNQPNFAQNFSKTDDMVNNNFYASGGTRWLSVITQEENSDAYTGEFDGEVITYTRTAEDNCQTEEQINTAISELKGVCGCNDCGSEGDIGTPPNGNGATLYNIYYGRSANTSLTEAQILALTSTAQTNFAGIFSYGAGIGMYTYLCYPVVLGIPTSFKDPNTGFDYIMLTPPATVSVLGELYYTWRSFNILGGAIDLQVNQ